MYTSRWVLSNVLGGALWRLASCRGGQPACGSVFVTSRVPSISIADYLTRLIRCLHDADVESVLIVAMIYLHRLEAGRDVFDCYTAHRLLASATWASMKFLLDCHPSLRTYSRLSGLREDEVVRLEVHFVHDLDWRLGVTERAFVSCRKGFLSMCSFAPVFPPRLLNGSEDGDVI